MQFLSSLLKIKKTLILLVLAIGFFTILLPKMFLLNTSEARSTIHPQANLGYGDAAGTESTVLGESTAVSSPTPPVENIIQNIVSYITSPTPTVSQPQNNNGTNNASSETASHETQTAPQNETAQNGQSNQEQASQTTSSNTTASNGTLAADPTPTKVCGQVVTRACSENTGVRECKDFPTPCDVPAGWTVEAAPPQATCAQVTVRACTTSTQDTTAYKAGTRVCQNFSSPCDVPNGWEIEQSSAATP